MHVMRAGPHVVLDLWIARHENKEGLAPGSANSKRDWSQFTCGLQGIVTIWRDLDASEALYREPLAVSGMS